MGWNRILTIQRLRLLSLAIVIVAVSVPAFHGGHELRGQPLSETFPAHNGTRTLFPPQPGESARQDLVEAYGRLPLRFEANDGQTDSRVKFLSRGDGYTLFLTSAEAVLALRKPGTTAPQVERGSAVEPTTLKTGPANVPSYG